MRPKEILSLVAILVVGLIVFLIAREKSLGLRLTKVENTLNDILDNSDQAKLALGFMIQEQSTEYASPTQKMRPVGFKYKNSNA